VNTLLNHSGYFKKLIPGNVGLNKSANMITKTVYKAFYPPSGALDGFGPLGTIHSLYADTSNSGNTPAEWWADLGDVYKIYNITIYGRTGCK